MTGRRVAVLAWGVGVGILLAGALAHGAGWRINTTASLPRGLWRTVENSGALRVGDVVTFCPPLTPPIRLAQERGYVASGACPGDVEPMLKPVVALAGDQVAVSPLGVHVNGRLLPSSAPLIADSADRPLPILVMTEATVPADSAWVVSSHNPRSYDSRYVGPISTDSITAVLRPLGTEGAR